MRRLKPVKKTVMKTVGVETVDTSVWGAHVWRILHTASFAAPASAWAGILKALDGALPCPDCREHYHAWILSTPVPSDLAGIRCWLLELHNQVNGRTGKATWTETDVTAAWGTVTDADIVTVRKSLAFVGPMLGSVGLESLIRLVNSLRPVVTPMPLVEVEPITEPVVETIVNEAVVPPVVTLVNEESGVEEAVVTPVNEEPVVEEAVVTSVNEEPSVVDEAVVDKVIEESIDEEPVVAGPTLIVTDVPLSAE